MDLHGLEDAAKSSELNKVNSRKRKYTSDAKDIENQRPAKRHGSDTQAPAAAASAPSTTISTTVSTSSTTPSKTNDYASDTQSSSDCYSTTVEFDINQLASPPSVNSGVLSPLHEPINSWNTKGDTTPHGNKKPYSNSNKSHASISCCVTPSSDLRECTLPLFSWADALQVWKNMCRKDEKASLEREPNMFDQHPGLQPRMRAILLDWLIEVCEVYKLHRETYYLAVDYIDRFLTRKKSLPKTHLQLLGITALFVAAKVEEIYPPKIGEFAYVTDGACSEDDILREELILLNELQWSINTVTVMGWLSLYMQINVTNRQSDVPAIGKKSTLAKLAAEIRTADSFVYPQFSGMEFAQTAQLIDLCSLDIALANFPYSVIAAAAMSHTFDSATAKRVSGLDWDIISPCAKWMEPYFQIICEETLPLSLLEQSEQIKSTYGLNHICPNIVTDNSHIIQTHTTSLDMFDKATLRREQLDAVTAIIQQEASPAPFNLDPEGLLTPPASSRKSLDNNTNINLENNTINAKTC